MGITPPKAYDAVEHERRLEENDIYADFYGDRPKTTPPSEIARTHVQSLNADQKVAFRKIALSLCGKGDQKLFFLEGDGGCGMLALFSVL